MPTWVWVAGAVCTHGLPELGWWISKSPTWDTHPDETHQLALAYDRLRFAACGD